MENIEEKWMSEGWRCTKTGNWYHDNVCQGMAAHISMRCAYCGETFLGRKHISKRRTTASGLQFCSRSCRGKHTTSTQDVSHLRPFDFTKGQEPHNYRGWHFHSAGYITLMRKGQRQLEHRKVMEQHLGRPLLSDEIVHHVNGHRTDNRVENLEVMTQSEHMRLHWKEIKHGNVHASDSW